MITNEQKDQALIGQFDKFIARLSENLWAH